MPYRPYAPPAPLLFGYDPERDLPQDHLARLVERVVEESLTPKPRPAGSGQPPFDPRLCAKVLVYGYSTGVRSSRQLERLCQESLPYLFLTRGDAPSYRTLCSFRVQHADLIEQVWVGLFAIAQQVGIPRLGRIVVDSSKLRADASPEAVVKQDEYEVVLAELQQILKEAEEADTNDDNDPPGSTRLDKTVSSEQMRDILRRVRKEQALKKKADQQQISPPETPARLPLGPRMKPRLEAAIAAIKEAQQEARKQACLTDPDARMMGEGREKRIRECHSYEVAVDNGLLVVGQSCQSPVDNPRLGVLVEAAKKQEPDGITAVDGDSGYFGSERIVALLEQGIDVCIPDTQIACDLHRHQRLGTTRQQNSGTVEFTYDKERDVYVCPQGNELAFAQSRERDDRLVRVYRAVRSCLECPLRQACGNQPNSQRRTLSVNVHQALLLAHLARFAEPAHQARYAQRGHAVETLFGRLRATLGITRWLLRGKERVAAEARLFTAALQIRKVHVAWAKG